jgi:hypothetical protein
MNTLIACGAFSPAYNSVSMVNWYIITPASETKYAYSNPAEPRIDENAIELAIPHFKAPTKVLPKN